MLRAIADDELELMLAWRNAPTVRANMYTRHEITLAEHSAWWRATQQRPDRRYFMYEYQGRACGVVGFTDIDAASLNASWAFYAAPDAPKGTGSRMELLALDYAFDELKLHKLHCEVLAFNEAVISLHQKFGFQVEGILRDQHKVDDKFVDVYRLGMLDAEWTIQRGPMFVKLIRFVQA
ncbi:UDP-4-amino-4,6-dideoxy-N-acetyl-beta-L-altrosamine N-acetyltransferase [Massilia sp. ZL223]|uniref:UDP-4-amino-4, 6-dideoxy-N-acetyl-beta-L-altrosamine N-acetyltransferase n=1 Tax=Massilia sp. ZL223 TaxID=2824904 RepID=UPI001B837B05|nr:UDP-4-amino-4,6-dideoxy-N-acetyl-beta-L-altrosamine N-acetyltransferase [Massilia sp. ZL223]MBQ5963374.1 UDP-4-amino-4,6-dideoxy-N-acetyl-beta-L-altrosamine N-acetyltransferase [Massilia sp. ZL223]